MGDYFFIGMTALSKLGPYALRCTVNFVFLLLARQSKQVFFVLTNGRFGNIMHPLMVGATVACGQQWLHSLENTQARFVFHSLAHCFSIAVDISAVLSKSSKR